LLALRRKFTGFHLLYLHDGELQCLECRTCDIHSLPSGLTYSAVGYGKCDQWSVMVEWSGIMGSYNPPESVVRDRRRMWFMN